MLYANKVEENIFRILEENKIEYTMINHESVYTSETAAKIADYKLHEGVKTIIMKIKPTNEYILVILPGDKKIDSKKIRSLTNSKSCRFAAAEEVKKLTGLEIGSCSPFGYSYDFKKFIDKNLFDNEFLFFNPGNHNKTIKLHEKNFRKIIKGTLF